MRVALCLAVTACATQSNHPYKAWVDGVIAANTSHTDRIVAIGPEPQPLEIGQWALYKATTGDTVGYERVSVIARDPCGWWIEAESFTYDDRHSWLLCVEPGQLVLDRLQVAIWQSNGGPRQTFEFGRGQNAKVKAGLEYTVGSIAPPRWISASNLPAGDVDVPAGHFSQAAHGTEKFAGFELTRWFHSTVPIAGTVKARTSDGSEMVLMGYGYNGAVSVLPVLASEASVALRPTPLSPLFIAAGVGLGWLSGHGAEAASGANNAALEIGVRVAPKLDVIAAIAGVVDATYSPDATVNQQSVLPTIGVRWSPFRDPLVRASFLDQRALYVQAGVGYAELDRLSPTADITAARGLGIGAAVGTEGFAASDWAMEIEVGDDIAFFNSGEGIRHNIGFRVLFQLFMPTRMARHGSM